MTISTQPTKVQLSTTLKKGMTVTDAVEMLQKEAFEKGVVLSYFRKGKFWNAMTDEVCIRIDGSTEPLDLDLPGAGAEDVSPSKAPITVDDLVGLVVPDKDGVARPLEIDAPYKMIREHLDKLEHALIQSAQEIDRRSTQLTRLELDHEARTVELKLYRQFVAQAKKD